uniref:Nose resistant-to-fluoxetine protein N-terminal domain-containing protein n=1 Tax=Mola mola TaxID=94237 RepID=A0A3Q3VMJ8_MOLML
MALVWVVLLLFAGVCVAVENTQALSQRCEDDTNTFVLEINQDRPKEYAVLMYDAFGKMGSNVEGGNTNQPGLLQQCRSAHGPTFSGQYCQVFLRQGTVQYFVGICVPDSCEEEEVKMLVLHSESFFQSVRQILHLMSTKNTKILCKSIAWIVFSLRHCLSIFSFTVSTSQSALGFPRSYAYWFLQVFSLQTASQGVFHTSSTHPGGGYSSLNGIRVLSLLWIMCGHSAQFPVINNLDNYKNWRGTVERSPLYVLAISGPVFLAVDTFLLLGGLLSVRSLLGSINSAEGKLSPGLVANYLFNRIKRIQPLHMFIMCLTIGLISLVKWGPYWFPFIDNLMDCKTYWWANVLLISNLLPVHEICIPWTWYLSLDFQCYATTPLLVYFYRLTSENYVLYYYVKPYTRYGPFLIGILTGIYLTTRKDQWQAALGWFVCLSVMAVLVGLAYILRETPGHPSVPHALYQGVHRPLWALAVTWIIVACEEGYGGFIKSLLSLGFWVPLSNISFACYLTHPVFIILYIGLQETPIHYTDINFMYMFLGHLALTLVVSCVFTVLIEKPYLFLKLRRT